MLCLVETLYHLVGNDVIIGILRNGLGQEVVELTQRTPAGTDMLKCIITLTTPGYSVSYYSNNGTDWVSEGHSHITKLAYLCEVMWRRFGQNITTLVKFFDNRPELKADLMK